MKAILFIWIAAFLFTSNLSARQWQDEDLDGVPNLKDACASTVALQLVDARGCSVLQANTQQIQQLNIMPALCFTTDVGQLYPSSCNQASSIAVRFEFAKSQVSMSQQGAFQNLSRWLSATRVPLALVGHTDSVGKDSVNQPLSLARAEQVKNILVEQFGFAENRFQIKGMGSHHPIASNQTDYGRKLNRRVEFIVIVQ